MEQPEFSHQAGTEPIPGYRLIQPLGKGGFGEVWKCEAPGGLLKAIKFVQGGLHALDHTAPAEEELRAIERIKAIRHPFLLSMERVEYQGGELVIVLELADRNLADVLAEQKAAGNPGISREPLLAYLREAAEALDVLNQRHGLQHLDVKPHNLFLISNHVKVGDFGLVQNMGGGKLGLGAITPLYTSPEVFQGGISQHSDQYSLAVVYAEMLTGQLPFTGRNARQLMLQHVQGQPELSLLPEGDRPVVARALAKAPSDRFPTCTDFVHALVSGQTEVVALPPLDTRKAPAARTVQTRNVPAIRPPATASEGLQTHELVSRTPLTETWRATARDGSPRLVTVVFGCAGPGDPAIAKLGNLRHPHIMPLEVIKHTPGRLMLCQRVPERTLRDAMADYQSRGQPGIPRHELLGHLRTVAEVLEHFRDKEQLQHLGLNSRVLALDSRTLVVQQMGLAQLVWLPANQNVAQLNARYSAPELVMRQLSPACDQYSLALVYHELLTGSYPPAVQAAPGQPATFDMGLLPPADRILVARALNPNPERRWGSPLEMVRALEAATTDEQAALRPGRHSSHQGTRPAAGLPPAAMQMRFGTTLTADMIRSRLEGFRKQWKAEAIYSGLNRLVYAFEAPVSVWQRWTSGVRPILEVVLNIGDPEVTAPAGVQVRTEVRLELETRGCTREQAEELLRVQGPLLAESVRQHLQPNATSRREERLVWNHPFQLCPVLPDGSCGPAVACQGKDISLNGIGFYLQGPLPGADVLLTLPQTPQTSAGQLLARAVRVQSCGDGWIEVGAVLLPHEEQPPEEGPTAAA